MSSSFFFSFSLNLIVIGAVALPSPALSGLRAQTWSPWSPHHPPLFRPPHSSTTQPTRRASTMSTKSDEENCIFLLGKNHRKLNTFSHSLNMECNSSDSMSVNSNPFQQLINGRTEYSHSYMKYIEQFEHDMNEIYTNVE